MQTSTSVAEQWAGRSRRHDSSHVVACIDRSMHTHSVVPHAVAIARALRVPVTLLQVLEPPPSSDFRADPVEWQIRHHEARNALNRFTDECADDVDDIDTELAEGRTGEEICRWARERSAQMIVLGVHGEGDVEGHGIGSTAREILATAGAPVLLVPASSGADFKPNYRRILVPLDGSSWSESVLALAVRLAGAVGSELILAYVVPVPELIEADTLEAEDAALCERLVARNERAAQAYLGRVRGMAVERGLKVRALTLRGDDIRSRLTKCIKDEQADLVVVSARGHGAPRVPDLPYGNVAGYLIAHSPVPTLVVRPSRTSNTQRNATSPEQGPLSIRPVV